jgi:hypothetical protein
MQFLPEGWVAIYIAPKFLPPMMKAAFSLSDARIIL